jgi:hypothetical protein
MFTVFFKSNPNFNKTYFQNENRRVKSKAFKTEDEAREFSAKVNGYKIVNPCGKII